MPFADAKYPPTHNISEYGGWRCHIVPLSNGARMFVREGGAALEIAVCERGSDEPDYWVCSITENGVLVFANSVDACERLSWRSPHA